MKQSDFKIIFTALGFLAIVMKGKRAKKDGAKQAKAMALLIEAFCRDANPELFKDEANEAELDQIIEDLKDEELHLAQLADLTGDKTLLRRVFDRLIERHSDYASDQMIAGEIEHFLEEEIRHKNESKDDDRQRSRG